MAAEHLSHETVRQYQLEERALIAKRIHSSHYRLSKLINALKEDSIAPIENIKSLRSELAEYHKQKDFLLCETMPQIIQTSLAVIDQ